VIREGALVNRTTLERLQVDDYVIALAPPEQVITLDALFSTPIRRQRRLMPVELGEFVFDSEVKLGQVCAMYGVPFEPLDHGRTLAEFLNDRLEGNVVVGDRVKIGEVELVVRQMSKDHITKVGLEIEPEAERLPILRFLRRLKGMLRSAE
jgi:potassium/hydrogen antiporter